MPEFSCGNTCNKNLLKIKTFNYQSVNFYTRKKFRVSNPDTQLTDVLAFLGSASKKITKTLINIASAQLFLLYKVTCFDLLNGHLQAF